MICISGKASRSFRPIIGVVAKSHRPIWARENTIFVTEQLDKLSIGYKACISSGRKGYFFHPDHIYDCKDIEIIHDGDIVRIDANGCVSVLWEIRSHQNAFMLTEACNCKCIMCPQPTRRHSPQLLQEAQHTLTLLKNQDIKQICITGGEPSLLGDNFIDFLHRCVNEHPTANIDILTNGKNFSNREFTRNVAQVATNNVCFCVSLHSDIDKLHDNIVGANDSFFKNISRSI
ncbi:radical SAM protein [Desulfovibrio sp.]|uniref:radical SAM protein n=1 Tax=Desulfovibrio sp. TaxID=885 RepID=UPI00307A0280